VNSIKCRVESAYGFSAWRAVQVDSMKTHLESAYGFSAWRSVQVDSIKSRVESACGFSARIYSIIKCVNVCFQIHLAPLQHGERERDARGAGVRTPRVGRELRHRRGGGGRGLHSSHFSAEPEPFLTLKTSPKRLNNPSTPAISIPSTSSKCPMCHKRLLR